MHAFVWLQADARAGRRRRAAWCRGRNGPCPLPRFATARRTRLQAGHGCGPGVARARLEGRR